MSRELFRLGMIGVVGMAMALMVLGARTLLNDEVVAE